MNRLGGHPLLIFLVCAGVVVTVYSLTLLPLAVTFLVVGLAAVVAASIWLYRSRAPGPAEISNLVGIGHPAEMNVLEAVHETEVANQLEAVYETEVADQLEAVQKTEVAEHLEAVHETEVADEPDNVSGPPAVATTALLPEQWQMLQRWVEMAAQAHSQPPSQPEPIAYGGVPTEMPDAWEAEPAAPAPAAQPAAMPVPEALPAAQDATPQTATPAVAAQEEPTPAAAPAAAAATAPEPPPPPRRSPSVFAQATTYQDGEITKRSQITLRLSGRMHR